jgi:integrase/recombinase XerD
MGAPSKHKIYTEFYQEQAVKYKKHLDILGLNPETTQSRYLYLREFFSYLEGGALRNANEHFSERASRREGGIFELQQITPKEIAQYNDYLKAKISQRTGKPIKQKSIYDHMRNLQQYLG